MARRFATADGCQLEIRGRRIYYHGPVPPESRHLQAFDYARWLFGWYLREYPYQGEEEMVGAFIRLLGARMVEEKAHG